MARIVVEEGANRGAAFPVDGAEVLLGRDLACAVPVYDSRASRRHCAIRREGDRWIVQDLGSRNGTVVNGQPVGPEGVALAAGDRIAIGGTVLRFEPEVDPGGPHSLRENERRHLARVLEETGWNKARAADALGIDRKTFYAMLAAYGIAPPEGFA